MAIELFTGGDGPYTGKIRPDGTVLIIGAGEAGVASAAALRDHGFTGRIALVTDEPGLPYERPPLSKEKLKADNVADALIRPKGWYEEANIDLLDGRVVTAVDPAERTAVLDGGAASIVYDAVLLATGARARTLAGTRGDVHYLRTREDAARLRQGIARARSMIVIGGGVIGLEVASTAIEQGLKVTVVDPAPRLMQRALAPEISALLSDLHRSAGVDLLLNCGAIELSASAEGDVVLSLEDRQMEADICVAGIGVVPNDGLARAAGCAVDNGVIVDGCGRTNVPGIFAAGDVAAFHHPLFGHVMRVESWQHAGRHGAHVARAMLGIEDDYLEVPWFWTDQLGTNIQVAGIAADCDETVWRGEGAGRTAFHFRQGVLRGVTTINNGRDMRPSTKLLAGGWSGDPALLVNLSQPLGKIVTGLLVEPQPA